VLQSAFITTLAVDKICPWERVEGVHLKTGVSRTFATDGGGSRRLFCREVQRWIRIFNVEF
jgi:hypothetical protein